MSTFGNLINTPVPVVILFHTDWSEQAVNFDAPFREIIKDFGDKVKAIKIGVDKNQELADALRIKHVPAVTIYNKGERVYDASGDIIKVKLIDAINNLI